MARTARLLVVCCALAVGCAGGPGTGRFVVALDTDEVPVGAAELLLTVSDRTGELLPGLGFTADVSMPSMGHGSSEDVISFEVGGGVYGVEAFFMMAGEWTALGTLRDGDYEQDFDVALDVVPE